MHANKRLRSTPIATTLILLALSLSTCAGIRFYQASVDLTATFPAAPTARLLYLFQLPDCVEYRAMERMVASVAARTGVPALGIPLDDARDLRQSTINPDTLMLGFDIETHDRREYEEALLDLGLTVTPAVVLVDSRGVARLVAPPTKEGEVLSALEASLTEYLSVLLPNP